MNLLKNWSVPLVFGVAFVATVFSGVLHGSMSRRWGGAAVAGDVPEKLREFPNQFNDWQMETSESLPPRVIDMLECMGYFVRAYRNTSTQQWVRVAVVVGPPGPTVVHTPEICFSSRQYAVSIPTQRMQLDGSQDEFFCVTFRSKDIDGHLLRVYYGWSDGGGWSAPDNRRFAFVGRRYLYKIQVAGVIPGSGAEGDDPAKSFLQCALPVLQKHLITEQ